MRFEFASEKPRDDPVRMLGVAFAHLQAIPPSEDAHLQTIAWRLVLEHGGKAMAGKAKIAEVAEHPLSPVEKAAVQLAHVILENSEGQAPGTTPRDKLLAGEAQELGQNLLELLDKAASGESA